MPARSRSQLQFDVTDFNGWQTAYGYDDGRSRSIFLTLRRRASGGISHARRTTLTRPAEARPIAGHAGGARRVHAGRRRGLGGAPGGGERQGEAALPRPRRSPTSSGSQLPHRSWRPAEDAYASASRSGPSGMRASTRCGC